MATTSYLKGYEVRLKDNITTGFTAMFQTRNRAHVLTVLYDDFGKEIARNTEKAETEQEAFLGVLRLAYNKREEDYMETQKRVYGALKEPVPSADFLKGEFSATADAKEILTLAKGVKDGN